MEITKQWLKEQDACKESYTWLSKQKIKDDIHIAKKLYEEKKYTWCLWLLYRKDNIAKSYIWISILLSYIFFGLSFYLRYNNHSTFAFAFTSAFAFAFAFTSAFAFAFAFASAFASAFAFAIASAFAFAFASAFAFAFAIAIAIAPYLIKIGCKITFKISKRYR